MQTYLGYCGDGADGCADFDASKAAYFKIQAEMNAIADKLRPNFDSSADGNRWEVPIPSFVPPGSYLMRLELSVAHFFDLEIPFQSFHHV